MPPIKPSEVEDKKKDQIPEEVFEAFNALITQNYHNGSALVYRDEAVGLASKKLLKNPEYSDLTVAQLRTKIYKEHWADVEPVYEKAGWSVQYDNEAYFKFTKRVSK